MKIGSPPAWLRWIVVLPATLFIYFAVWNIGIRCTDSITIWWGHKKTIIAIWEMCVSNVLAVCIAMCVGTYIAPSRRKVVSIVLAGLFIAVSLLVFIEKGNLPETRIAQLLYLPRWQIYCGCISMGLSAILSSICIIKSNETLPKDCNQDDL